MTKDERDALRALAVSRNTLYSPDAVLALLDRVEALEAAIRHATSGTTSIAYDVLTQALKEPA